jgi:hypothetical protein
MRIHVLGMLVFLFCYSNVIGQIDSTPSTPHRATLSTKRHTVYKKSLTTKRHTAYKKPIATKRPRPQIDSLSTTQDTAQYNPISTTTDTTPTSPVSATIDTTQTTSFSTESGAAQQDASPAASGDSLSMNVSSEKDGLTNIVFTDKSIRAYGWGEYQVMGRCLCCDNALDGDCILVQSTNSTDRARIKQVVDKKYIADTSDKSTYFGDVMEREREYPVSTIMIEISYKKIRDIYAVDVYTMIDNAKKKNYLSNCELNYYDQFDRLRKVAKVESKWTDDRISFKLEKPILTKSILLKVKGGKSRITEVALFAKNDKQ